MANVQTKLDGHVLTITIDRPEVYNALDPQTYFELSEALNAAEHNDDIWLITLTGRGNKAFSAGRDLKQLAQIAKATEEEKLEEKKLWEKTVRLTDRFNMFKPVIAKVNGLAFGGGFELALAADIIIAADHVRFALPEPKRGLIATAGGVHRLPRQIGLKAAMGFLLTGQEMTAQRAYELGLVNEVCPPSELDRCTNKWIEDMLACAPLSLRATKQCAMEGLGLGLPEAMQRQYEWETKRLESEDALEGPRAFSEKRLPNWSGR